MQETAQAKRQAALAVDQQPPRAESALEELTTAPLAAKRRPVPTVLPCSAHVPKELNATARGAPQWPLQGPLAGAVVQQRRRLYCREHEPRRVIFSR